MITLLPDRRMPRAAALFAAACFAIACSSDGDANARAGATGGTDAVTADSVRALTDSVIRIADASRIKGSDSARVWLIVMSDFQCPVCVRYYRELEPMVQREYVDRGLVRLAYLNLPGPSHPHAHVAAEYALCAGLQNRFFEYHDALFDSFDDWNTLPSATEFMDSLAVHAGLDAGDMNLCTRSGILRPLVTADANRSIANGAKYTPSFLIGSKLIDGLPPWDVLKRDLDAAIAAQGGASGIEPL